MNRSARVNKIEGTVLEDTKHRIVSFLKDNPIGLLATADKAGKPHGAVVYYSVDDNFNVYFTTKRDTKKSANLQVNNQTMLVAYEASSQATVQVTGIAEEVTDAAEAEEIFTETIHASLETSELVVPPVSKLRAGGYVAYCIRPTQIRLSVYSRPNTGDDELEETIEFED